MDEINNLGYKALIICSDLVVQLDLLNQGANLVGDSWNLTNAANATGWLRKEATVLKNCLFRQLVILSLKNFGFNFSLLSVIRAPRMENIAVKIILSPSLSFLCYTVTDVATCQLLPNKISNSISVCVCV